MDVGSAEAKGWWRRGGALALTAGLLLGRAAAAGPSVTPFEMSEVSPGNYVHIGRLEDRTPENLGDQANIGFIVGDRCVAVIDPGGSLPVGLALKAALRRVTDKPVCYVVITHFHPDHLFGAAAFRDPGTEFVAHRDYAKTLAVRARPYVNALKRDLGDAANGSDVVAPTRAVDGETTLDLGGRTLRLKAWPVAHTDNDLTVLDETTGTLWLGDLLFCEHTPVIDGSALGFLDVMTALAQIPARHFVPGHGRTVAAWPQALVPQREYLELVVRETRASLKRRMTIEEAVDTVGRTEASKWVNFDLFHRRNVTTTYTELEWE